MKIFKIKLLQVDLICSILGHQILVPRSGGLADFGLLDPRPGRNLAIYLQGAKMNWYFAILFLHITAAIIYIGGIFARQVVRSYAKKTDDVHVFAVLSQAAGRIESLMVIPGNIAVILFGMILALMIGYPIFGFLQGASQNWLLVSNILLALGLLAVPVVFIPRGKKFDMVLKDALAEEQMTPELRTALDDRVVQLVHLYEDVSVVIIVALMVLKPF